MNIFSISSAFLINPNAFIDYVFVIRKFFVVLCALINQISYWILIMALIMVIRMILEIYCLYSDISNSNYLKYCFVDNAVQHCL